MFCSPVVVLEGVFFVAERNGLLHGWRICSVCGDGWLLLQYRRAVRGQIGHGVLEETNSWAGERVSNGDVGVRMPAQ